jgi:hypothetical protein
MGGASGWIDQLAILSQIPDEQLRLAESRRVDCIVWAREGCEPPLA